MTSKSTQRQSTCIHQSKCDMTFHKTRSTIIQGQVHQHQAPISCNGTHLKSGLLFRDLLVKAQNDFLVELLDLFLQRFLHGLHTKTVRDQNQQSHGTVRGKKARIHKCHTQMCTSLHWLQQQPPLSKLNQVPCRNGHQHPGLTAQLCPVYIRPGAATYSIL